MALCQILTDDTLRELKEHGKSAYPIQCYMDDLDGPSATMAFHWHREIEVVAVKSGRVCCLIGSARIPLTAGEGIFINSGVIHGFETDGHTMLPNILFAPEFIAPEHSLIHEKFVLPFLESDLSHARLTREIPWQREALDRFLDACAASGQPGRELDVHAHICRMWSALHRHREGCVSIGKTGSSMLTQARARKMIDLIDAEYPSPLTLPDIARAANVSKSEALRCFRAVLNTTPVEYLNRCRLLAAAQRLAATEDAVSAVAASVGFDSASYFDRVFKRAYGASPKAYRARRRGADADLAPAAP